MKNIFMPDIFAEKVQDISFNRLKIMGIKGLIIDLDNTLVPWHQKNITEKEVTFIRELKESGFRICILSNGSLKRIKYISNILGVEGIWKAIKPRKRAFEKALHILKTQATETAVIGDQIFTDIIGGNRIGSVTILVNPLSKKEFFGTKLLRLFECFVFKIFLKK